MGEVAAGELEHAAGGQRALGKSDRGTELKAGAAGCLRLVRLALFSC